MKNLRGTGPWEDTISIFIMSIYVISTGTLNPQTAEEVPHKVKARYPAHFQLLVFNLGLAFLLHTGFGPRL